VSGLSIIDWQVVDLSHSSPATVVIEPVFPAELTSQENIRDRRGEVVSGFFGYMHALASRNEAPEELDRATLGAFKELIAPVNHGRIRTSLSNGAQSMDVVGSVEAVIEAILAPRALATGSVQGRLEFINIHGGRNVFRVYPVVGPDLVECAFPEELLNAARVAVGSDVRVFGQVTYLMRDPFPHSIHVARIEVIPDDAELPSLLDIRGMAPDATGILLSEDFVRELRAE